MLETVLPLRAAAVHSLSDAALLRLLLPTAATYSAARVHPASDSGHGRDLPSQVRDGEDRSFRHLSPSAARDGQQRGWRSHHVPHSRAGISGAGKAPARGRRSASLSSLRVHDLTTCASPQISHEFERFCAYLPDVKVMVIFGGVDIKIHKTDLKAKMPHIVVGTPGRVKQVRGLLGTGRAPLRHCCTTSRFEARASGRALVASRPRPQPRQPHRTSHRCPSRRGWLQRRQRRSCPSLSGRRLSAASAPVPSATPISSRAGSGRPSVAARFGRLTPPLGLCLVPLRRFLSSACQGG